MISEYTRGDNPIISYAIDLSFLDNTIKFKDGLNFIIGPNGTGKTTLLRTLAKLFFCEQQGYPKFNGYSDFSQLFDMSDKEISFSDCVRHNRFPVLFNNRYEKSHFDDENFEDSFNSIMVQNRNSAGELQNYELNKLGQYIDRLKSYTKLAEEFVKGVNSLYQNYCDKYIEWLKKEEKVKSNKITILLDEPTSNMDIANRISYWEIMTKLCKRNYQIITAIHDVTPFIVCNDYHIIESEDNYFNKSIKPYLKKLN